MPVEKLPKLIAVVGPTASGKTGLAIKIAAKFGGEVVSADSRQVYRKMDIGTAKPPISPTSKKRVVEKSSVPPFGGTLMPVYCDGIPHYLIDIKNPDEEYTLAEYKRDAIKAIKKILSRGKVPVIAGGTGLYVKAVTDNLSIPEVKADNNLRKKIEARIKKEGLESVYRELVELDPGAASFIDGKNPRRVIRALEVTLLTGRSFSEQRKKGIKLFDVLKIGIKVPDAELRKRMNERIGTMIKKGLVKEVSALIKKYGKNQRAFDAIGYKEIISFLGKKISATEAEELMKKNTVAFAKRQMTWFRKDKEIKWIKKESDALKLAERFLKKTRRT